MIITKLMDNAVEDLKVQLTLEGFCQLGKQRYDMIKVSIPENLPLIIEENFILVDCVLFVANREGKCILFNDYTYIHNIDEKDIIGLIDRYEIEQASECHIDRFYFGEEFNDFISSPCIEQTYLVTCEGTDEEEIYD